MSRFILVTGGARSGKSTFAESKAKTFGENVLYVATSIPFDDEMKMRIRKHRKQRPENWKTLEAYKDLHKSIKPELTGKSAVLIDCVTIMITNILFDEKMDWENIKAGDMENMERTVNIQLEYLMELMEETDVPFILVTNEVGMGLVPEYYFGRVFRDIAGRVNQVLARKAGEVYFCVSGIPVKIK